MDGEGSRKHIRAASYGKWIKKTKQLQLNIQKWQVIIWALKEHNVSVSK